MYQILLVSSLLLWSVVLLNLLLTIMLIRHSRKADLPPPLTPGVNAPAFTAHTLDGSQVTLADYSQRPLCLVFVSPHCDPCKREMASLGAHADKARVAGTEIVLISVGDFKETLEIANDLHHSLSILVAPTGQNPIMEDYRVSGVPFVCLIDARHRVVATGYFGETWAQIKETWEATSS